MDNEETKGSAAEIIAGLATALAHDAQDAEKYALVPEGYSLEGLEKYQDRPARKRGDVVAEDSESFLGYVKNHQEKGKSQIFASPMRLSILCILDCHSVEDEKPGWGDHKISYKLTLSDDVLPWVNNRGKPMGQTEFAEFIEANIHTVSKPTGAELLTQVEDISVAKSVKINRRIKRQDGSMAFSFSDEENQPNEGRLPAVIEITVPLYQHGAPVTLRLRLQYRTEEGKFSIKYIIDRWAQTANEEFMKVARDIGAKSGLPLYIAHV